ncbi:protein furry homolog-like isoform X1 [Branchiostoma floridae x Branchiostoma belcheri]
MSSPVNTSLTQMSRFSLDWEEPVPSEAHLPYYSTGSSTTSGMSGTPVTPQATLQRVGSVREKQSLRAVTNIDPEIKPGEYVLRSLFTEFTVQAERKIEVVLAEPLERPLSKSLQRGEDPQFDQLLSSLNAVAEHCLPSLLRTLFEWYDRQNGPMAEAMEGGMEEPRPRTNTKSGKGYGSSREKDKDYLYERRDLAVDFIFCLVLIEVLKQSHIHPIPDSQVKTIENLAFKHFKHREGQQSSVNASNLHIIADLYAEVIGVLTQSEFHSVRRRFMSELKELRSKEQNMHTTQGVIALIMGMKFFRVKLFPVEDLEASFQFMQECGKYFLEVKDKDIKHALAGLFVEILVPVAAAVKNDVMLNLPAIKCFVEMLYQHTLEMSGKKKHALALFPLVTCLLCVSQKQFFLNNWHYFLSNCLSHLKNRDPKMSRVALESLYRLLWVYMIRIKCESNTQTQSRLQNIVNSLFPKGSRNVVPRDTPLNIFVKIIQFIAQERLDFAMREIVFDLLCVGRPSKLALYPERMNIGLRAFLVIADSLEQKDGEPPMPSTVGVLPSGNTLRVKKTFLNKMLTDDTAKQIGIQQYYPAVRKSLDGILRALDLQVGRSMSMTNVQCMNKEPEDMITGERKPKIDLFRTCVAAIPRLIPEGMSKAELIDMLSRLTVHMDEELRNLAFTALQNLVLDFPAWREDVLNGFIAFVLKEVHDTHPLILDSSLRMLVQFLTHWRTADQALYDSRDKLYGPPDLAPHMPFDCSPHARVLHRVEGFALVILCSCRPVTRKLGVIILKEVRTLLGTTGRSSTEDETCIDVMDRICPAVVETCLPFLAAAEKAAVLATPTIDLQWLADRQAWIGGVHDTVGEPHPKVVVPPPWSAYVYDPWSLCLAGFLWYKNLPLHCPAAVSFAWPDSYCRLTTLFSHIDPNNPANQGGSLRGTKKMPCATDEYIGLWRNYLVFACRIAPPSCGLVARPVSPDILSASPDSLSSERADNKFVPPSPSGSHLFKLLVPLIRSESVDVQGAVVAGLGRTNAHVFRELMEEMHSLIKEALERKQENMRRRRRRDCLRVQLGRILELVADSGVFSDSCAGTLDKDSNMLVPLFVEYMDGMRMFLESEGDKDSPTLQDIRLHFSGFVHKMIRSIPVEKRHPLLTQELRYSLFFLLANWCGRFGVTFGAVDSTLSGRTEANKDLKLSSLQKLPDDLPLTASWAPPGRFCRLDESLEDFGKTSFKAMSAVLCSGPVFDSTALSQDGYLYNWLDSILDCQDDRVHQLGRETVVLLLTLNPEVPTVLNWAVDRCYTGSRLVAAGCFHALAAVLCERDYPCDMVAVLNVTLFKTGDPCNDIRDMALQLLQVLDNRFFGEPDNPEDLSGSTVTLTGSHLPATFTKSQMFLSQELSRQHPEFTIPMFSEISHRLHRAHPEGRQVMMEYLLPWLQNLELVDEFFSPASTVSSQDRRGDRVLRGEGWGSVQATNMVLNNLLYITAKYGDEHPRAVEQFWATMVQHWPNNLHVILEYLINMAGITTQPDLLPYVKRAVIYLCRAKPDQMVEELMNELQSVEIVNAVAERISEPPYYRLSCSRKTSSASTGSAGMESPGELPHGELSGAESHTPSRRFSSHSMHKTEEATGVSRSDSVSSHRSTASQGSISSCMSAASHEAMMRQQPMAEAEKSKEQVGNTYAQWKSLFDGGGGPLPLPMPENGGYYCPLSEYLRETATAPVGLSRCNLGVVLLAELVLDRVQVEWTVHLPLMLHTLFLGLDHSRSMVHEHCKKLLLNLLIVLSSHNDYLCVARTLLTNRILSQIHCLSVLPPLAKDYNFIADPQVGDSALPTPASDSGMSSSSPSSSVISGRSATPPPVADSNMVDVNTLSEVDESAKALIEFITTRSCRPLWCYEDLTSRQFTIRSAEQMCTFLRHVVRIFSESLPGSHLQERWGQIALHMALSCSSRHYAGRSFQMFRALQVSVTSNLLCDILARLVETVADPGEDMQGYVTEILLTLESLLDKIAPETSPPDYATHDRLRASSESISSLHSTPNLHRTSMCSIPARPNSAAYTHHRSASMSKVKLHLASPIEKTDHHSNRMLVETRTQSYNTLPRSRSTQSMKSAAEKFDTRHNLLSQLFWVCVSLLESDYDHEFLLALKLMDRLLSELPLDRSDCVDEVNRVRNKLKWTNFPGMQMLLFKGFTSPLTSELTLQMVAKLTVFSTLPVVDPSEAAGFPLNVLALMPYLINHYDSPDKFCTECAENIAEVCLEKSKKLHNLAHIMSLYSNHTFGKPCKSWVSAVCKYLHDAYSDISLTLLTFLVEILEKGMMGTQQAVLQLLYSLLHQVDLGTAPIHQMNADLLRIIAKYVQSNHWQESLNILKLAVQRSSTLVSPEDIPELKDIKESSLSLTDIDVCPVKRDLPGPTLEFRFDVSQTPIIGRRVQSPQAQPDVVEITIEDGADDADEDSKTAHDSGDSSSQRQSSSNTSTLSSASTAVGHGSCMIPVCWKKPHLSQRRTRERLVNVLSNCGQNVGLPKSPSVIFSSSSDLALDRQTSMYSSSDEVSPPDLLPSDNKMEEGTSGESGQHFIFKDFDFLDAELEEAENSSGRQSEGLDNFNWGVRRRSLDSVENGEGSLQGCQLSGSVPSLASADMKDESSDDESISPSEEALPATIDNLPSASAEHKPLHPTNTADTADGTDDQLPSEPISMEVHKDQSSALSISSVCSEGDGADTSPGTSPHFSSLTSEFLPISMDEIEEVWLTHVGLILSDNNGTCAVNTFQLFARLYRITRRRFYNLTRECCNYLGDKLRGIASQFLNMLELLVSQAECPHIFTDTETILSCKLLERHKFAVLEIQEHYDTYICKRDATVECLDKIKESLKRQSLGEEAGGNGEQQQIELCRHLYKLHFQLLLLFQSYSKLVKLLSTAANAPQVTDFSRDATDLKARLQQAIYDVDNGSVSQVGQVDTVSLSRQVAEDSLLENLKNGQLTTCVQLIRAFRSMWPNLVFGSADEDDMEYLLALFCKHVADNKTGVLVMTRADTDLSGVCHRLMEVNIQLLSSLKLLELPPKSPQSSPSSPSPTTNL